LSFSGARSGGKGVPAKKAKKQKREFHTDRKRPARTEETDIAAAKVRVLEGLAHLGQQKFTPGPGGYDLTHWLRGLNLLLDDFEAKTKGEELPAEYHRKREEVASRFSGGVDTSGIESEVEAIRKEESEIRSHLAREMERITARLAELRVEKEGSGKEIEEQKAALEEIRAKRRSASFFARLSGRAGPPTEPVEQKIGELEKQSNALEEEALSLQSARASIQREGGKPTGLYEQQWVRLDAIGARLKELEAEVQERTQLAKEREVATAELTESLSAFDPEAKAER
jgi:chromosome segregation ATPase